MRAAQYLGVSYYDMPDVPCRDRERALAGVFADRYAEQYFLMEFLKALVRATRG
jgi:hypothetical protein